MPAVLAAGCLMAACAPLGLTEKQPSRDELRCDLAVAEGMSTSKSEAITLAEQGTRQQYADARGYLLGNGFRQIRVIDKETRCRRHPIAGEFYHCTAQARLCGR